MVFYLLRKMAPFYQHPRFHVLVHGMTSQIGAGDETSTGIGNCDFGVYLSSGEFAFLFFPKIEPGLRQGVLHFAYEIR